MKLRWKAITCDAQRLLTKSQMWGKLWHATVQAGGWVGVRSGREKHLPGKTPQTAPPSQDLNVVNAATKVDPRAMAEPGSRYPEGDGPPQAHIFHMLSPPVFDRASAGLRAGRSVFNLSVSGRPRPREAASEPRKQKTKNKGGAQGPGAQRAVRPSAKGGSKGWEVVGRSAGRVVDGPGRSGRSME